MLFKPAAESDFMRLQQYLTKRGINLCISGIDGAGKTTLSDHLVEVLSSNGIPVRRLHIYNWYANILWTPILMFLNKFWLHKVQIFDRCIYDNIAKYFGPRSKKWVVPCVMVVNRCYPAFDRAIFLHTSVGETMVRRPDTNPAQFGWLQEAYDAVVARADYEIIESDAEAVRHVVGSMALLLNANCG